MDFYSYLPNESDCCHYTQMYTNDVMTLECEWLVWTAHASRALDACLQGGQSIPAWVITHNIMCSNDVEMNPGPVTLEEVRDSIMHEIKSVKEDLGGRITTLSRDVHFLGKRFDDLELKIGKVDDDVGTVQHQQDILHDDVGYVTGKIEKFEETLSQFDTDIDRLEAFSRRDNVILYDVKEDAGETPTDCRDKITQIFNQNVQVKKWQKTDVIRAHRLGAQRSSGSKARPIIAKLAFSEDKFDVLKARPSLKESGYGVSTDLTVRQRQQLQAVKDNGMFGYFKNGKLITKPRLDNNAAPSGNSPTASSGTDPTALSGNSTAPSDIYTASPDNNAASSENNNTASARPKGRPSRQTRSNTQRGGRR